MESYLEQLVTLLKALPAREQDAYARHFMAELTEDLTAEDDGWDAVFSSELSQKALEKRAGEIEREIAEGKTTPLYEGLEARSQHLSQGS